jgi:capsular exopolysaccharide synthesis family protein
VETLPSQHGQGPAFVLANSDEESSFDFWGVLNRRKWLVFLGLVTGMALGGLYHAQCPEVFESRAKVNIVPKNSPGFKMTSTDVMRPNMEKNTTRHDRLIGQHNIVHKCLLDLMDLKSFDDIPTGEVVSHVIENIEITPDKEQPTLYELKYRSSEAVDSQTVLNNLIATYRDELDAKYKTESSKYIQLLQVVDRNFNETNVKLQDQLNEVLKEYKVPNINQNTNVHQLALTELTRSMEGIKAILNTHAYDRERAVKAFEGGPEKIADCVWNFHNEGKIKDNGKREEQNAKNDAFVEARVQELDLALREVSQRFGPRHPSYKAVKEQLQYYQDILAGNADEVVISKSLDPAVILNRHLKWLEGQLANNQSMLENQQNLWKSHYEEAARLQNVERRIDDLKSQLKQNNEFITMSQKKIVEINPNGELSDASRDEGYIFETVMNATYGKTIWPILPVILGIGGLLGLLSGFGLGCLVELADKTFHNPDEIMKQLNVPLIGHVPVIGQSKRYLVENSLIEPIVCTYHRPKSQVSESFRAVRTALYFNTQGKQHSVIQVTSPTPGDGKSTLASNLAVSIAQSGKRILLVDGDMRRPRQAATFGISSKEGFATVLSGRSQWRDVVYECEEIEGLTVMPCGAKPNNPAELSSSPQVKELIEEMRSEFDFVIIDTPPLLAVTDACPIAARVDGVMLCIRIKKNVRVSAERATEMLANLGANCIGLVVNGVGAQSGYGSQYTYGAYRAGYSYNGYGYGYGYGYGAGKYYDDDKKAPHPTPSAPKHIEAKRTEQQHPPVA